MNAFNQNVHYAGFWRRVLATVVDTLLLMLFIGVIDYLFFGSSTLQLVQVNSGGTLPSFSASDYIQQIIIILFTVVMWMKFLGTPGKIILGCQVVDANTLQPISSGQAVLRYLAYYVSLFALGLGFVWVAFDKRKQGFHDKIAKTVVIMESASVQLPKNDKWDESQKSLDKLMSELK